MPLIEMAALYLRKAIHDGRLRPGMRLRQEAIATELGASRIPVREALRSLEYEGLVKMAPRSGIQVARLDYAEQAELHRIREELEPLAAMSRRAARGDGEAVPSLSYGIHSNGEIEDLPPSPTTICRQANSCYTS